MSDLSEPGLQADQRLLDRAWLRIGVGLAVAGQAMVFSLAVNLTPPEGFPYWILHGGLMISAFAVLVFLGGDLIGSALAALRGGRISIDLLFLVTLGGALAGSLTATITRTGSVYYEVVAILVVVHTAGKMLGARSRLAALRAVDSTRERFDRCQVRGADGRIEERVVSELGAGALVVVAPGGAIAVDGEIVTGRGYVQETSMTGEWRPVSRTIGDRVLAGTFSIDGSFEIRAAGGLRRLDSVLAAVVEARLAPSELQRQADKLVSWFLPVVAAVSLGTFAFWIARAPWDRALFNAMAVLLVACPCAAGLATPVAVWSGMARAAAIGLVARTGDLFDQLARCDVVCLDKTGTLSGEELSVREWRIEQGFQDRGDWLRSAVALVEEGLAHPVGAALRKKCNPLCDKLPGIVERRIEPGLGVVAVVEDPDRRSVEIRIGEAKLGGMAAEGLGAGNRVVRVFVEGQPAAAVELEEVWRDGLEDMLVTLPELGVSVEILTGDPAPPVGRFPGAIVRAGLSPADKLARVKALVAEGRRVVFVGDGLNDAAAMSAAGASIAMRGGADLARASATGVFAGGDLRFLPGAIAVARGTLRRIRTNLGFAAAYNGIGMALAASGHLHPVAAALLMVGSSAFVLANTLRPIPLNPPVPYS